MGMWSRKSLAGLCAGAPDEAEGEPTLRRDLTASQLVLMGVGGTIGAGIFVITGVAAAEYAGPAVALSFALAGFACLCTAFCYAELGSMMPIAGGAYTYAHATLGQLLAWMIGWCLTLEYMIAGSAVAVGWSGYFANMLSQAGIVLPPAFVSAPLTIDGAHRVVASGALFNVPAALLVAAIIGVLLIGIRQSVRINALLVGIKVSVILLVILFGAFYVETANLTPFIPAETANGRFGWAGIATGAGVIFFAYVGFDGIATSAQEVRNPQRDMSLGLLGALLICTLLYVGISLVITGLVHYSLLNVPNPVAVAVSAAGPRLAWLLPLVNVGAMIGLASVVLVAFYSQTRLFYAMSCDGLLPEMFRTIHPVYRTPWLSTLMVGAICFLVAGLFPVSILGELVSVGTLLAFASVCVGVLVLRRTEPNVARSFRTPFSPLVPALGLASCAYLMASMPSGTWMRLLIWLGLGLAIYFAYGRRHARETRH